MLEYNDYVPTGYDPAKKYPVVPALHAPATDQTPPQLAGPVSRRRGTLDAET
jgi:hypothetical protein